MKIKPCICGHSTAWHGSNGTMKKECRHKDCNCKKYKERTIIDSLMKGSEEMKQHEPPQVMETTSLIYLRGLKEIIKDRVRGGREVKTR